MQLPIAQAQTSFNFFSSFRNRTYTIQTSPVAEILTTSGKWLYEPSMVSPSSKTGNQWALLWSANRIAGQDTRSDIAIYLSTSSTATSGFSAPTEVLRMSAVNNICDMIDARPVWVDGLNEWFVFLQALEGTYTSGCSYPAGSQGRGSIIIAAHGPTLNNLQWITNGSGGARPIIYSTRTCAVGAGACGIGEEFQVFNTTNYSGPGGFPILVVYNDWSYTSGGQQFTYIAPNPTGTWYYWSDESPAYAPAGGSSTSLGTPNPYRGIRAYPDVILAGSLDESSKGNPGFAPVSSCDSRSSSGPYLYDAGVGFFPDPVHTSRSSQDGIAVFGGLASKVSDSTGQRMFTPRFARNEYGYVPPSSSSPRQWQTYMVYNDQQTGSTSSKCSYANWNSTAKWAVSSVTITEQ